MLFQPANPGGGGTTNTTFIMEAWNDADDIFKILVDDVAATTISTVDDGGAAGHLTLDIDGDITLDAASGNIYVKDNGGNYTPGSDYEIATKKYVDDNAGGASALNDLSDVTYSSGDLTISSLDTIVAGANLTIDAVGDIILDADGGDVIFKDSGTTFASTSNAGMMIETGGTQVVYGVDQIMYDGDDLLQYNTNELTITNYLKIAESASANFFNDTAPSDSLITLGANNVSNDFIMYSWHDVPGLQKFGSYEGNNNNDGVFVELGFRPSILLIKRVDNTDDWLLYDGTRRPINVNSRYLRPNRSNGENTGDGAGTGLDLLSNGFKIRSDSSAINAAETYIYAAWAEAPTVNLFGGSSNAR